MEAMFTRGEFLENFENVANFSSFPMVIGVSVFSMGVVPIVLPIKYSMNKPEEFSRVEHSF